LTSTSSPNVTQMLLRVADGDRQVADELMPLVYDELRAQAARLLRQERPGLTLQATALVHEAYLRLVSADGQNWQSRAHFFAAAATAIRRILIEHARRRSRLKRGGELRRISLDEAADVASSNDHHLLAVDEALTRLAALDPDAARVVELRFFAGLTVDEVAAVLNLSPSTVARAWRVARAWLQVELEEPSDG
jgi:RNA polymerase sigma factor (TIGR02999 family)